MDVIYKPRGKALEDSPLACNLYMGCNFGCIYCYAPRVGRKSRESYSNPVPRKDIIKKFEKSCIKYNGSKDQVLFCFMTDPYNELEKELEITRTCLQLALKYKIPVSILTKSGMAVLRDLDIIKKFGSHIQVGATLTMGCSAYSIKYEPHAADPLHRSLMLKELKENGVRTWASIEPVIYPEESLDMIKVTLEWVDYYKIGKINHFENLDKTIDWTDFLKQTVSLLRSNKKPFYIKKDLREAAPGVVLYENEINTEAYNLRPFED